MGAAVRAARVDAGPRVEEGDQGADLRVTQLRVRDLLLQAGADAIRRPVREARGPSGEGWPTPKPSRERGVSLHGQCCALGGVRRGRRGLSSRCPGSEHRRGRALARETHSTPRVPHSVLRRKKGKSRLGLTATVLAHETPSSRESSASLSSGLRLLCD